MIVSGILAIAVILLLGYVAWKDENAKREREAFANEREAWVRERRDLNTRIQAPEAAPFMLEEGTDENDLPSRPEPTLTEEEYEKAQQALIEAGYEEGLVG